MSIRKIMVSLLAFYAVGAWGACPTAYPVDDSWNWSLSYSRTNKNLNQGIKFIRYRDRRNSLIFFCHQRFSATQLTHAVDIVVGGSKNIPYKPAVELEKPIGQIVYNLSTSPNPNLPIATPLRLTDTLTKLFPHANGAYNSKSLFNFYTIRGKKNDCENINRKVAQDILRRNQFVRRFVIHDDNNAIIKRAESYTTGLVNEIAIIRNAEFSSGANTIKGDLIFYWANPVRWQFFTNNDLRACWVGIGVKFKLNPNSISASGNFNAKVGVVTLSKSLPEIFD